MEAKQRVGLGGCCWSLYAHCLADSLPCTSVQDMLLKGLTAASYVFNYMLGIGALPPTLRGLEHGNGNWTLNLVTD